MSEYYYNNIKVDQRVTQLSGVPGGLALLDSNGKIPLASLPEIQATPAEPAEEVVLVEKMWDVPGDGIADATSAIKTWLELGGHIYVPEGDYFIANAGSNTGGVTAIITKDLFVRCHPKARFFTDGVDNDLIRIQVPSNGAGLPADGITLKWTGGFFDQENQKVSQVVPFRTEYPPSAQKDGDSNTCDGLYIVGSYTSGTDTLAGIKLCMVSEVSTYGGPHWRSAGGDSGIFTYGCEEQHVFQCRNYGNRDLGIYMSGTGVAGVPCRSFAYNNLQINCFHAIGIKRSSGTSKIFQNHAENCVRGFLMEVTAGDGFTETEISRNTGNKLNVGVRAQGCTGFSVVDNHFTSLGCVMENGTTIESVVGSVGFIFEGCKHGSMRYNTFLGETSGVRTTYPSTREMINLVAFNTTETENMVIIGNVGDGLRVFGTDEGLNNSFIENCVYNAQTSANMTVVGTNYFEVRLDPTTNARSYNAPLLFSDGSISAPIIARRTSPGNGIRFTTNTVAMTVAGVDRFATTSTGVGFNGTTAIAKPTLNSAATDTASTQALVNSIRSALINYGLCS